MSQPNPFSRANAQEHNLVSKLINPPLIGAPFQAVVDLVDIHTAYALQIGTEADPVQLEYVKQIGDPEYPTDQIHVKQIGIPEVPSEQIYVENLGATMAPVNQAYVNNIGSTGYPVGELYVNNIGDEGASGNGFFDILKVTTLFCRDIRPPPSGGTGATVSAGAGIGVEDTSTGYIVSSLISGGTGIDVSLVGNTYQISNTQRFIQGNGINIDRSGIDSQTLTLSSVIQGVTGSTGIVVANIGTSTNQQLVISSTVTSGVTGVTGGTGIQVLNGTTQFPSIVATGIQKVTGGTGIQVLNGTTQFPSIVATGIQNVTAGANVSISYDTTTQIATISSTGGGTGGNPAGPTGQIPFFTASGLLSVPSFNYDGTHVNVPALEVSASPSGSSIYIEASGLTSTIYSGMPNSGNILNITDLRGYESGTSNPSVPTMTIDTLNGTVGIGNVGPTYSLDVVGNTRIVYDGTTTITDVVGGTGSTGSCQLSAGSTYKLLGWGGGGAGNGGTGGAGGYSEVTYNPGVSGATLYWDQRYGGTGGGGDALVCWIEGGTTFLYVPGGGAGVSGGAGAAAGETQAVPRPEGGVSSTAVGVTAEASYTDATPWIFAVNASVVLNSAYSFSGGDVGITGGTFTTGGNIYGTVSTIPAGTTATITFNPGAVSQTIDITAGTTYYLGTTGISTINIQGTFVFSGVTFKSNPGNLTIPDNTVISVSNVDAGTTGIGSAIYKNWSNNPSAPPDPEFTGVSTNLTNGLSVGSGNITLTTPPEGITFTSDQIGVTWFFASSNLGETEENRVITIGAGSTMIFPGYLLGNTGATISTTGQVTLPTGSQIAVADRQFIDYGATVSGSQASIYGGGGYVGGGEPALVTAYMSDGTIIQQAPVGPPSNRLAGGGAGSWYIESGITGITYGGSGIYAYSSKYGSYGDGSTGFSKNPGYLIVQKVDTPSTPNPALTVNGNLEVDNGDMFTDQGIRGRFISVRASDAPAGDVINGIPTKNGGKMMWNVLSPGTGRTELLNAWGDASETGFGFFAGQNGATATGPTGPIYNLGAWDVSGLLVNGTVTGTDVIASSDIRTKENIVTVDSALDRVLKMRGVFFERKVERGERRVGVIAQEVEEVLPEVVYTDADGIKSVSYGSMVGLLIEAIKEQNEQIKRLT